MRNRFKVSGQADEAEMWEQFLEELAEDMAYDRYALYAATGAAMRPEKATVKEQVIPKHRHRPGSGWAKWSWQRSTAWIKNFWLLGKWSERRRAAAPSPFTADDDQVIEGSFVVIEDDTSVQEASRWRTGR